MVIFLLLLLLGLVLAGLGAWGADSRDPNYSLWPRSDGVRQSGESGRHA
jgi:hypothetical protein